MQTEMVSSGIVEEMEYRVEASRGSTVLIVDDVYGVRKLVRRILEDGDINVIGEAENGDDAVLLSRLLKPDIVIMDYNMNSLNGIDATRQIIKESPGIKIIFMTGQPMPSMVIECMRAGASNFLIKPFDQQLLLKVVRNVTPH